MNSFPVQNLQPITASVSFGSDAASRELRIVSLSTWAPSAALCIAHAILSDQAVPAIGLVPQTLSAVLAFLLLRARAYEERVQLDAESGLDDPHTIDKTCSRIAHPLVVFFLDVVLAGTCLWVLVMTWTAKNHQSHQLSMLAAYTTVPIMANFSAHSIAGFQSIYKGLSIGNLLQLFAYRMVPAECPHCHENLRPAITVPWLKRTSSGERRQSYVPVLVSDTPPQTRYHDDSDADDEDDHTTQPESVDLARSKRNGAANGNGKRKMSPSSADGSWGQSARVY